GADAGDGVVEFEVAIAIPCQGRHAVARFDTKADQSICQLADALAGLGVPVAVDAAFYRVRDNLHVGVDVGGVVDHAGNEQRSIHHQPAQHWHGPPTVLYDGSISFTSAPRQAGPAQSTR